MRKPLSFVLALGLAVSLAACNPKPFDLAAYENSLRGYGADPEKAPEVLLPWNFLHNVSFDFVAFFYVVVIFEEHTAFVTCRYFFHVVFEPF